MDELHPLLLMTKTELRLAKKLIKQSDDDDKREQASNRLAELSEVVLGREIGLKKYMVIRVEREDGFTLQLQVLSFLISYFRGYIGVWNVSGRNIRKDGTLGLRDEGLAFRNARISRRMLDGSWATLQLRKTT